MADYFRIFSTVLPIEHKHLASIKKIMEAPPGDDDAPSEPGYWGFEWKFIDEGLWLWDESNADLDRLSACCELLVKNGHMPEPVMITWAETCSKMRPDSFSGGAMLVTKRGTQWFDPGGVALKTYDQLEKARTRRRK